jgi:hypothetical protein
MAKKNVKAGMNARKDALVDMQTVSARQTTVRENERGPLRKTPSRGRRRRRIANERLTTRATGRPNAQNNKKRTRRKNAFWTDEEKDALALGVGKYGTGTGREDDAHASARGRRGARVGDG